MTDITIGQQRGSTPITRFLGHRDSIILFLALTMAFTILLVVFGQPTSLTQYTSQHTSLSPLGQVSICFTVGLGILIMSRAMLFFIYAVIGMQVCSGTSPLDPFAASPQHAALGTGGLERQVMVF